MRQPRTRKSTLSQLQRKLTMLVRNVVGRKWGNYLTLSACGESNTVSFSVKRDLKRSVLNDLYQALKRFAQGNKGVAYRYGSHAVSLA